MVRVWVKLHQLQEGGETLLVAHGCRLHESYWGLYPPKAASPPNRTLLTWK